MSYISIEITSAGLSLDNNIANDIYYNPEFYSSGTVTLAGNVSVNPTVTAGNPVSFSILWNASVVLSTFSVTICGTSINQSDVNGQGQFNCFYDGTSWNVQYSPNGIEAPQANQTVSNVLVPPSGGTLTLTPGVDSDYIKLSGSPTVLVANYAVDAITSGVKDRSSFTIQVMGGITLGSNTLTIFGQTIAAVDALNGGVVVQATFDTNTSSWASYVVNRTITTSLLPDIVKLSLLANSTNADGPLTPLTASSDGDVFYRSGTSLVAAKLVAANFGATLFPTQITTVALSASAILNSNTTPIKVLDAAGAGKICPIFKVFSKNTFISTAYTTNLNAIIKSTSGSDAIMSSTGFWGFAASGINQMFDFNPGASATQYVTNDNLMLSTSGGNPAAGNGTCLLYILHSTISI